MTNHCGADKVSASVRRLAAALLVLLAVGGSTLAAAQPPGAAETIHNRAFRGVEIEDGVLMLLWSGKKDALLARDFTLNVCGQESVPTTGNLQSLVGRPFEAVLRREGKRWLVTRLEFKCQ